MRLPLPTPAAVIGGAAYAAETVETALSLVPRAAAAMERIEALLDRVEHVVDAAETVADRAEKAVDLAEGTNARAAALVERADLVTTKASRAVDEVTGVSSRADTVLGAWEPVLRTLSPAAKRFADGLSESEVAAAITLVDRLPVLLEHVENDVLPVLRNLDRVGPDLHEVLEVVEDLRRVVTGLPGIGFLRKRGEEEPPPVEGSVHDHPQ